MGRAAYFITIALAAVALAGCSKPAPPTGRWEGAYETGDTMVAARLEIEAGGRVRASAPDLSGIGAVAPQDRIALREQLAATLDSGWDNVAPRDMEFDGDTFRKPGGVAPQMLWNGKQMTMVVYLGKRQAIHIPLKAVNNFSDNPWPSG